MYLLRRLANKYKKKIFKQCERSILRFFVVFWSLSILLFLLLIMIGTYKQFYAKLDYHKISYKLVPRKTSATLAKSKQCLFSLFFFLCFRVSIEYHNKHRFFSVWLHRITYFIHENNFFRFISILWLTGAKLTKSQINLFCSNGNYFVAHLVFDAFWTRV